jgi:DNA transposition AAA+ family ATPase
MSEAAAGAPEEFIVTKEYRRFAEFCDACQRDRYIGLCYGPPGVGKTLSARQYSQWDVIEAVRPGYFWPKPPPSAAITWRTVLYTAPVTGSPGRIEREVREVRQRVHLLVEDALLARDEAAPASANGAGRDLVELLIVDEADRLRLAGLEQLRDLYDRSGIGLILIGMPGLERRMARYPQLYSRVGFVHQYRPLSGDELRFILAHKWEQLGLTLDPSDYTDAEALAAITSITGGNFRLIQRLFTQIERLLAINGLRTITGEVVMAARQTLVIGEA